MLLIKNHTKCLGIHSVIQFAENYDNFIIIKIRHSMHDIKNANQFQDIVR